MQQQVGRRHGRTTGPGLWGQNAKTPLPDSPKGANGVSDVFVVGGATAVGYLSEMLSEICANSRKIKSPSP
jgi:hypothetical protein